MASRRAESHNSLTFRTRGVAPQRPPEAEVTPPLTRAVQPVPRSVAAVTIAGRHPESRLSKHQANSRPQIGIPHTQGALLQLSAPAATAGMGGMVTSQEPHSWQRRRHERPERVSQGAR